MLLGSRRGFPGHPDGDHACHSTLRGPLSTGGQHIIRYSGALWHDRASASVTIRAMLIRFLYRSAQAAAVLASCVTATTVVTVDGIASHAIPPFLCKPY